MEKFGICFTNVNGKIGAFVGNISNDNQFNTWEPKESTGIEKYFEDRSEALNFYQSLTEVKINPEIEKQSKINQLIPIIQSSNYVYSRNRGFFTYIYGHDPKSPSGVICIGHGESEIVDPLLRQYRNNSPLSPTEGLYSPSKGRF